MCIWTKIMDQSIIEWIHFTKLTEWNQMTIERKVRESDFFMQINHKYMQTSFVFHFIG